VNKYYLLNLINEETDREADELYSYYKDKTIVDGIYSLSSYRKKDLPTLPKNEKKLIKTLRDFYKDNIAYISFVLNKSFPGKYIFYRPSKIEDELFMAIDYFKEIEELFEFDFTKIGKGKSSFKKYIVFNEAILEYAKENWGDVNDVEQLNNRIMYFLYDAMPK